MLDEAAAAHRRTLSAEITERLELSFSPYADPEAVQKAYERGRTDALIARQLVDEGYADEDDAHESAEDARLLFESLPASAREAIMPVLEMIAARNAKVQKK